MSSSKNPSLLLKAKALIPEMKMSVVFFNFLQNLKIFLRIILWYYNYYHKR